MRDEIAVILGKRIRSLVVSVENSDGPSGQLFIVFDDDTVYELYGDISSTSNLTSGGANWAINYARKFKGKVTVYD